MTLFAPHCNTVTQYELKRVYGKTMFAPLRWLKNDTNVRLTIITVLQNTSTTYTFDRRFCLKLISQKLKKAIGKELVKNTFLKKFYLTDTLYFFSFSVGIISKWFCVEHTGSYR